MGTYEPYSGCCAACAAGNRCVVETADDLPIYRTTVNWRRVNDALLLMVGIVVTVVGLWLVIPDTTHAETAKVSTNCGQVESTSATANECRSRGWIIRPRLALTPVRSDGLHRVKRLDLPRCTSEDGTFCYWHGRQQGNHQGHSVVTLREGRSFPVLLP